MFLAFSIFSKPAEIGLFRKACQLTWRAEQSRAEQSREDRRLDMEPVSWLPQRAAVHLAPSSRSGFNICGGQGYD